MRTLGGIDVLINCAGITWPGYVDKIPDSVWDSMIQVDYMGTVNMVRAMLPYFMEQKHGSIANVSSVLGYMGVFGYAAYGPAKYAVVGFSECLRQDLLPYNITVSVIYPPDTDTPQLREENKIKPPETKVLSGNIKVMKPETIAFAFLKGIAGSKFTIVPGAMNKFTCFHEQAFSFDCVDDRFRQPQKILEKASAEVNFVSIFPNYLVYLVYLVLWSIWSVWSRAGLYCWTNL